jgi:hypothetical protein
MKLIAHRRNTIQALRDTDRRYGIEVDIRSNRERLIICHDPFVDGEPFEDWIGGYQHGTLILNVKEEGLEARSSEVMKLHAIENYFFLDQSFPFLLKGATAGERRSAVRVSEFESIETALALAGKVDWVWVDCFTRFPLNSQDVRNLRDAGFKLCIASPELQQRDPNVEIPALVDLLCGMGLDADAVCTKRPEMWEQLIESA